MASKRKSETKDLNSTESSLDSDESGNDTSDKLNIPGGLNFDLDASEFEERVKKLKPPLEDSTVSDESGYIRPDLNGDVQRLLNKTYTAEDFVKKQRLPGPDELSTRTTRSNTTQSSVGENGTSDVQRKLRASQIKNSPKQPRLSIEEKTTTPSLKTRRRSSSKELEQVTPAMRKQYLNVTSGSASSTKSLPSVSTSMQMEPPKAKSKKEDTNTSSRSSAASASNSGNKSFANSKMSVLHSTPIDPRRAGFFPDYTNSFKLTPIASQMGTEMLTVPRPAAKKNSSDKNSESDVPVSNILLELESSTTEAASFWDFKRKSINNWIQGSKPDTELQIPAIEEDLGKIEKNAPPKRLSASKVAPTPAEFGSFVRETFTVESVPVLKQNSTDHKSLHKTKPVDKSSSEPKVTNITKNNLTTGDSTFDAWSSTDSSCTPHERKNVTNSISDLKSPTNSEVLVFARKSLPVIPEMPVNDRGIEKELVFLSTDAPTYVNEVEIPFQEQETSKDKQNSKSSITENQQSAESKYEKLIKESGLFDIPVLFNNEQKISEREKEKSPILQEIIQSKQDESICQTEVSDYEQQTSTNQQEMSEDEFDIPSNQQEISEMEKDKSTCVTSPQEQEISEIENDTSTNQHEVSETEQDTSTNPLTMSENDHDIFESEQDTSTNPLTMSGSEHDNFESEQDTSMPQLDIPEKGQNEPTELEEASDGKEDKSGDFEGMSELQHQTSTNQPPENSERQHDESTKPETSKIQQAESEQPETSKRQQDESTQLEKSKRQPDKSAQLEKSKRQQNESTQLEKSKIQQDESTQLKNSKIKHEESTQPEKSKKPVSKTGSEIEVVTDSDIEILSDDSDGSESDAIIISNKRNSTYIKSDPSQKERKTSITNQRAVMSKSLQYMSQSQKYFKNNSRISSNTYERVYSDVEILSNESEELESDEDEESSENEESGEVSDSEEEGELREYPGNVVQSANRKEISSGAIKPQQTGSDIEVLSSDEYEDPLASDEGEETSASDEGSENVANGEDGDPLTSDEGGETSASDEEMPVGDEIPRENVKMSISSRQSASTSKNISSTIKLDVSKSELKKLAALQGKSNSTPNKPISNAAKLLSDKEIEEIYKEMLEEDQEKQESDGAEDNDEIPPSKPTSSKNVAQLPKDRNYSPRKNVSLKEQSFSKREQSLRQEENCKSKIVQPASTPVKNNLTPPKLRTSARKVVKSKMSLESTTNHEEISEVASKSLINGPKLPTDKINTQRQKVPEKKQKISTDKKGNSSLPREKVPDASKSAQGLSSSTLPVRSSSRQRERSKTKVLQPVVLKEQMNSVSHQESSAEDEEMPTNENTSRTNSRKLSEKTSMSRSSLGLFKRKERSLPSEKILSAVQIKNPKSQVEQSKPTPMKANSSQDKIRASSRQSLRTKRNLVSSADDEETPATLNDSQKLPAGKIITRHKNVPLKEKSFGNRKLNFSHQPENVQENKQGQSVSAPQSASSSIGQVRHSSRQLKGSKRRLQITSSSDETPTKNVEVSTIKDTSLTNGEKFSARNINTRRGSGSMRESVKPPSTTRNSSRQQIVKSEIEQRKSTPPKGPSRKKRYPSRRRSRSARSFESSSDDEEIPAKKSIALTNGKKSSTTKSNTTRQSQPLRVDRKSINETANSSRQQEKLRETSKSVQPTFTLQNDNLTNQTVRTSSRQRERSKKNLEDSFVGSQEEYLITKQQMASSYLSGRKSVGKSLKHNSDKKTTPSAVLNVNRRLDLKVEEIVTEHPKSSSRSTKLKPVEKSIKENSPKKTTPLETSTLSVNDDLKPKMSPIVNQTPTSSPRPKKFKLVEKSTKTDSPKKAALSFSKIDENVQVEDKTVRLSRKSLSLVTNRETPEKYLQTNSAKKATTAASPKHSATSMEKDLNPPAQLFSKPQIDSRPTKFKLVEKSVKLNSPKKAPPLEDSMLSVDDDFGMEMNPIVSQSQKSSQNSSRSTKMKPEAMKRLVDHISKAVESPLPPVLLPPSRRRTRKRAGSRTGGISSSQSSINPSEIYGEFLESRSRSQNSTFASRANLTASTVAAGSSKCAQKEDSPPPSPILEAPETPEKPPMSKEEYFKLLNENLNRRGIQERLVQTDPNFIDKEKLKRCALIWGGAKLTEDELEFFQKKCNDESLKILNGLRTNSSLPGGVFTYREFQATLVEAGLIEDSVAEPRKTMCHTWTTKQQLEAKRIGLMPLSKCDDPNIIKISFLKSNN